MHWELTPGVMNVASDATRIAVRSTAIGKVGRQLLLMRVN